MIMIHSIYESKAISNRSVKHEGANSWKSVLGLIEINTIHAKTQPKFVNIYAGKTSFLMLIQ